MGMIKKIKLLRKALALWMVLSVVIIFSIVGTVYFSLSRGLAKQVEFIDSSLRAQYIAESVFNELYSKLISSTWEDRWFASNPDVKSRQPLYDGYYDYYIGDNHTRPKHVDVFIKAEYKNSKKAFYWLVKYKPSLLVGVNQGVLNFQVFEVDPNNYSATRSHVDSISSKLDEIINERKIKEQTAINFENDIKNINTIDNLLQKFDLEPNRIVYAPTPIVTNPSNGSSNNPTLGTRTSGYSANNNFITWVQKNKDLVRYLTSVLPSLNPTEVKRIIRDYIGISMRSEVGNADIVEFVERLRNTFEHLFQTTRPQTSLPGQIPPAFPPHPPHFPHPIYDGIDGIGRGN